MKSLINGLVTLTLISLGSSLAARPQYVARIPNGRVNVCATCQVNPPLIRS